MQYYPEQRHVLENTTIRRDRFLPEDAIGRVEVREGVTVNLREIVARGRLPSRYTIVEAASFFRLRNPDDLPELMLVGVNDTVEFKTPLAGRADQRGKRLLSPVAGLVSYIGEGRIVIQESPEEIELEAGLDGVVVESKLGRGVVIETFGTVVQGVWGNGRRALGPLKMEPDEGLESILGEEIDIQYRGAIVVTRRPLRETGLITLDAQNLAGVIAPSMNADLIPLALDSHAPVLLTEGFGPVRMSAVVFNMLNNFEGRQAALDAVLPNRWETRRPEVILNPTARSQTRPPRPNVNLALQPGVTVRLTRPPNAGATGKVTHLPKSPILLENGLRVPCALVETVAGERLTVPLANIEVLGR